MKVRRVVIICFVVLLALGTRSSGYDVTDDATDSLLARLKGSSIKRRAVVGNEKLLGHNDGIHVIKKRLWSPNKSGSDTRTKGGSNLGKKKKNGADD